MRITEISTGITPKNVQNKKKLENHSYASFNSMKKDSFSFTGVKADNVIRFKQVGKTMSVVSFTGLNDPTPVAIQFKVRGVTKFQTEYGADSERSKTNNNYRQNYQKYGNHKNNKSVKYSNSSYKNNENAPKGKAINNLADSNWVDGKALKLEEDRRTGNTKIIDPDYGQIGLIPEEIGARLKQLGADYNSPEKRDENFRIELSNMVAGTTKGAKTTGLRVNLIYTGKNSELKEKVENTFNEILNDKESNDLVFLYQPKASPDEVLAKIFENDAINNNTKASKVAQEAINNIVDVIDDQKNKSILLVGHCKPDGDTLGCILGLKNAIDFKYSDKNVDCAIDDKIPGLFRHKLPGIDGVVKRPLDKNQINKINNQIAELKESGSKTAPEQIKILQNEKASLQNPANLINQNKKYDVVVLMDIPTPKRFTDKFKNQIENANKVIYIDHHPHRLTEWQKSKEETGVDMEQIHKNGLAWVSDAVPAATEQVAIIAKKLIPNLGSQDYKKLSQDKKDKLDAFIASTVVGMSTDTGAFTRTANLLPEHMKLPVQQRPNFMPEGLSKWLMGLSDKVNKKWIREEITYDIADTKTSTLDESAREQMVNIAKEGKKVFESLSLGVVNVSYDQMNTVWKKALETETETTFLDIQNAFKYSESMGVLRSDPSKRPADPDDYTGDYDDDRIAILICQDKKEGELDEKFNIAKQNGLRLSLRSSAGSDHAELLAGLFGGGGHGGASGGRVDLPGVEVDSKLGVVINGKKETNIKTIYNTLKHNLEITGSTTLTPAQKAASSHKIELIMDDSGKNCTELIEAVTIEIREHQDDNADGFVAKNNNHPTSFKGLSLLERKVS